MQGKAGSASGYANPRTKLHSENFTTEELAELFGVSKGRMLTVLKMPREYRQMAKLFGCSYEKIRLEINEAIRKLQQIVKEKGITFSEEDGPREVVVCMKNDNGICREGFKKLAEPLPARMPDNWRRSG